YGFAYNDATSYTRGQELYSKDGGHTFQVEPGRVLKFTTSVTPHPGDRHAATTSAIRQKGQAHHNATPAPGRHHRAAGCDLRTASHRDRAHGITGAHHHGA